MLTDSEYLKQVVEEDQRSFSQNYLKLQEEVSKSMTKWRNIFDEQVRYMLGTRAKRLLSSKEFLERANLQLIEQAAQEMRKKTAKGLQKTKGFGYTDEDIAEAMPKIETVFNEYLIEYREDFHRHADAHLKITEETLIDSKPYTQLREYLVKSHCDTIDERLHSFKRTTKYANACFAAFVEVTDKRDSGLPVEVKIERCARLRTDKIRENKKVFEDTLAEITEFNHEFIKKVTKICLPCSLMKNRLEELEEDCRNE